MVNKTDERGVREGLCIVTVLFIVEQKVEFLKSWVSIDKTQEFFFFVRFFFHQTFENRHCIVVSASFQLLLLLLSMNEPDPWHDPKKSK